MKIITTITTYNRPQLASRLLTQVLREMERYDDEEHLLIIVDDASNPSYTDQLENLIESYQLKIEHDIIRWRENNGKEGFWRLQNRLYQYLRVFDFDYVFMLQDDMQLKKGAFQKAIWKFNDIPNPQKVCLNLYRDHREAEWGSPDPVEIETTNGSIELTQWTDLPALLVNRNFFEKLDYSIHRVERDWKRNPTWGSGVGSQISRRIRQTNGTIWRVMKSLVIDDGSQPSQMNPNAKIKLTAI